jgi:hypothetical protein
MALANHNWSALPATRSDTVYSMSLWEEPWGEGPIVMDSSESRNALILKF